MFFLFITISIQYSDIAHDNGLHQTAYLPQGCAWMFCLLIRPPGDLSGESIHNHCVNTRLTTNENKWFKMAVLISVGFFL